MLKPTSQAAIRIFKRTFWAMMGSIEIPENSGCWEWPGQKQKGYGTIVIYANGAQIQEYAHRISYVVFNRSIPGKLFVCHTCDNPSCCRPDHLFVGTSGDNMRDAAAKGKFAKSAVRCKEICFLGGRAKRKLTNAQVKEARRLHAAGLGIRSLERKYKISHRPMWLIIHGETYK